MLSISYFVVFGVFNVRGLHYETVQNTKVCMASTNSGKT